MEISCLHKTKLFQYTDPQASMKLCHKKLRVLLFIPSGLQKESSRCCWRPQFKPPLPSALTLSVSFPGALPVKAAAPLHLHLASWTACRATSWPRGRGWVCATEAATENANALEIAVLVPTCRGVPFSTMEISRKAEVLTLMTLQGIAWSQLLALYCSWGKEL